MCWRNQSKGTRMTHNEVIKMLEAEWRDRLKAAVLAEREACADLCEQHGYEHYCGNVTDKLAETIRARGQA